MSKSYTLKPRKLTVEFRDSRQASAHGGQLAIAALIEQFDLKERVRIERALDPRTHLGKGFAPLVYVNLALSWQVLLTGPFVADQILGATSATKESPASDQAGKDVSSRLPELLEANASLWLKEHSYLCTDSASSAGKNLEAIQPALRRGAASSGRGNVLVPCLHHGARTGRRGNKLPGKESGKNHHATHTLRGVALPQFLVLQSKPSNSLAPSSRRGLGRRCAFREATLTAPASISNYLSVET